MNRKDHEGTETVRRGRGAGRRGGKGRERERPAPRSAARSEGGADGGLGDAPKSGFRLYVERCTGAGRQAMEFPEYLEAARRWREEYEAARRRGDRQLVRELEVLLCEEQPGAGAS